MCDTFIALPPFTADGSLIFGKNSDREPNEAQVLEYHPAREYRKDRTLHCTYREVPQARETRAVLLCRPFWMWGAEMGANEKGVVIGNEAVWTRMPIRKEGVLTGMDLLRIALERSSSAQQALETVVQHLSDYGQGGLCGYEDKRISYHNSYIIADPNEAWVLETAGPLWAALKIKEMYSISNGLTIGEEFDKAHPELIATARNRGWLKKGRSFHFARCYSDYLYTTFSASRTRRERSFKRVAGMKGTVDVTAAFKVLRDHGEGEYRPDSHLLGNRLCAHAGNRVFRNATQTVGSLVAHLKPDFQTYWATGTSAPCISIFKPIWFGNATLPDLGPAPTGSFDSGSVWWHHEKLHRTVLQDFPTRARTFQEARDGLEKELLTKAPKGTGKECTELTAEAFKKAWEKTTEWTDLVQESPVKTRPGFFYNRYWKRQNRKAGIVFQ
ncbi:MAG: C69 family dipeptidase [Deltaproteobacteria bacterium]|nr:C69 family dipeptidase [Deltaproteobacteria bacterium]